MRRLGALALLLVPACFSPSATTDETGGTTGASDETDSSPAATGGPGGPTSTPDPTAGSDPATTSPDPTDPTDPTDSTTTSASSTGSDDGSSGNEGSTTSSIAACDTRTHVCTPALGAPWSEPFAMVAEAIGCQDAFPDQVAVLHADLSAPAAQCDCSCGNPTVTCSTSITATGFSGPACTSGEGANGVAQNACYSQALDYTHSISLGAASSSCAAGAVAENVPAADWDTSDVACEGQPAEASCIDEADLCLPRPGDGTYGTLCVMQEGDNECPAAYPDKTLYYDGFDDTRGCPDSCSCSGQGATCVTSVARYTGSNCGGNQVIPNTNVQSSSSACVIQGNIVSMRPGTVTVQNAGTCAPGTANPSGAATPTGALTVCCTTP